MYFNFSSGTEAQKPSDLAVGQFYQATDTMTLYYKDMNGVEQRILFDPMVGANGKLLAVKVSGSGSNLEVVRQVGYTDIVISEENDNIVVTSASTEFDPETMILTNISVNYATDATPDTPFGVITFMTSEIKGYGTFYFEVRS